MHTTSASQGATHGSFQPHDSRGRARRVARPRASVARRGGAVRVGERGDRDHVGHLVAHHHRARHVLVAAAHGDLPRRHRGRRHQRMARAAHHLRRCARDARGVGALLEDLLRAARRVGVHLGHVRDAHVGALRRLVAQRVRPRRRDPEPAACGARVRHRGHPARRPAHDAGAPESRRRGGRHALPPDVRGGGGFRRADDRGDGDGVLPEDLHARVALLSGGVRRLSGAAGGGGVCLTTAMAGDHGGGRLHRGEDPDGVDPAALSGHAPAGAHLPGHHAHGADGLSAPGDRAGRRARPADAAMAAERHASRLGAVGGSGARLLRDFSGGAVAVRGFPHVAGREEPAVLRRQPPVLRVEEQLLVPG